MHSATTILGCAELHLVPVLVLLGDIGQLPAVQLLQEGSSCRLSHGVLVRFFVSVLVAIIYASIIITFHDMP